MFFESPSNPGAYDDLSFTSSPEKRFKELDLFISGQMSTAAPTASETLNRIGAIPVIVGNEIMDGSPRINLFLRWRI
jgi:hypothetical protein